MYEYVVELLYLDFKFDSAIDAARFLKEAAMHLDGDASSFRMKVIKVELEKVEMEGE